MPALIDLHCHSHHSDGTLSPAALVAQAQTIGLAALAITDHDTTGGVAEALQAGASAGLEVIAGIEMSTWHKEVPLHILGYGLDPRDPLLQEQLLALQEARHRRNIEIIARLNQLGIAITMSELAAQGNGQLGRPHIAQLLVAKGVVKNLPEAFQRFLKRGSLAYVPRQKFLAEAAIATIRAAGGVAVLAHPFAMNIHPDLTLLLRELKGLGLSGVEVYYPLHTAKNCRKLNRLCAKFQLLATAGSDFHGQSGSFSQLGVTNKAIQIPADLLLKLQERMAAVNSGKPEVWPSPAQPFTPSGV